MMLAKFLAVAPILAVLVSTTSCAGKITAPDTICGVARSVSTAPVTHNPILFVHGYGGNGGNFCAMIARFRTDIQTTMTDAKALAAANPSARFLAIEGMNHILKTVSGTPQEQMPKYSDPTLPVVPQLLDEMAAFVRAARKTG